MEHRTFKGAENESSSPSLPRTWYQCSQSNDIFRRVAGSVLSLYSHFSLSGSSWSFSHSLKFIAWNVFFCINFKTSRNVARKQKQTYATEPLDHVQFMWRETMVEWKLNDSPVWKVTTFQVTLVFRTAVWGSSFKQNVSRNAVAGTWQSKRESADDTKQRPNWQIAPRQQLNSSQRLKIKVQDKAKEGASSWHFGTLELGWKICGAVASTQICSDLPSSLGLEVLVAYDKFTSQNQVNCAACILQDRLISAKIRNRGTRSTHHATCRYYSCRKPWPSVMYLHKNICFRFQSPSAKTSCCIQGPLQSSMPPLGL